jgi:hypothetical protein
MASKYNEQEIFIIDHRGNEVPKLEVIEYFNTNEDNRTSVIAKYFGISPTQCSRVIERHLSSKKHYMGPVPYKKTKL